MFIGLAGCGGQDQQNAAPTVTTEGAENVDAHEDESAESEQKASVEEKDTDTEQQTEDAETATGQQDEVVAADMNQEDESAGNDMMHIEGGSSEGMNSAANKFVRSMKIGWNLGNTFDAYSDQNKVDEMAYESDWCGIVTTKEMVDEIKAAGFQTMRIPVSWHNHVTSDGNYTISEAWLNRVQEVVDYAIDNDMHVIINIHHDNSTSYMYPTTEHLEQSKAYVAAIWSQVAARFADYDEHLIMEGLNEPRLVGTSDEWWLDLNKQQCVEAVQCINELNQVFVDTVRAAGGNNGERYLLVPGYAASLQGVTNRYFELPQDIAGNENKILVEVHAYTPYDFALRAPGEGKSIDRWSADDKASTAEIDELMDTLYKKYVQNGIGVVIDEFGARDKNGNTQARTDFAAYYVAAARQRGITCCWWDNNAFTGDGENFGIFRRRVCSFLYPELVEGMMEAL
ncbi:MAG: glycoside hydrolase family 5 protein [Lachnospiraceae bacterium]|nr:glycoside hydrolase family 5 protein [Lachnospiraceae bacterium]